MNVIYYIAEKLKEKLNDLAKNGKPKQKFIINNKLNVLNLI